MSEESISPRSAERLTRAARAAQALSETLWEALHEELADPTQRRVGELSRRLADVSATVALLAGPDSAVPSPGESSVKPVPPVEPEPSVTRVAHEAEPSATHVAHEQAPPSSRRESSLAQASSMAVIVDELAPRKESDEPAPRKVPEIEIRDERAEAPSEWIASIARLLERYARDGASFAVLLVELADVERLRHAELPGEVSRLTGSVEAALSGALRPADSLMRESPGRYWLLAPETDTDAATVLAERMASAVRGAASHRGASLEIAVGVAVCPRDGSQAAALAARAEIALYAARAAGKPVA